jgi:hypothetical protein
MASSGVLLRKDEQDHIGHYFPRRLPHFAQHGGQLAVAVGLERRARLPPGQDGDRIWTLRGTKLEGIAAAHDPLASDTAVRRRTDEPVAEALSCAVGGKTRI